MFRTFLSFRQGLKAKSMHQPKPFYDKKINVHNIVPLKTMSFQQHRDLFSGDKQNLFSRYKQNKLAADHQSTSARLFNIFKPPKPDETTEHLKEIKCILEKLSTQINITNSQQKDLLIELIKKTEDGHNAAAKAAGENSSTGFLMTAAAWATIILPFLFFLLQFLQDQEKEAIENHLREDKEQRKAERVQNKIEKICSQYAGLVTYKVQIENNIEQLETQFNTLNNTWWSYFSADKGMLRLQIEIEKMILQLTLNKMNELEVYVDKQVELEKAKTNQPVVEVSTKEAQDPPRVKLS